MNPVLTTVQIAEVHKQKAFNLIRFYVETANIGGNSQLDRKRATHYTVGYPNAVIRGRSWACTDPLYLRCQMWFRVLFLVPILKLRPHPATAFAGR